MFLNNPKGISSVQILSDCLDVEVSAAAFFGHLVMLTDVHMHHKC